MSRRFSKFGGIFLLVLFAYFFASTTLFTHTHEGQYGKIVHSHPWGSKNHDHTSSQLRTITFLSTNVYDVSAQTHVPDCQELPLIATINSDYSAVVVGIHPGAISLRGPPMSV